MTKFEAHLGEADRALACWRWRIPRRSGVSEDLTDRVAKTCEIDPFQFSQLVRCGCEPATAVRILGPDEWVSNPYLLGQG